MLHTRRQQLLPREPITRWRVRRDRFPDADSIVVTGRGEDSGVGRVPRDTIDAAGVAFEFFDEAAV